MSAASVEKHPEQSEAVAENEEAEAQQVETAADGVEPKAGNEFDYLERNEFTSEIYKIEVKNMGYFGIGVSEYSS